MDFVPFTFSSLIKERKKNCFLCRLSYNISSLLFLKYIFSLHLNTLLTIQFKFSGTEGLFLADQSRNHFLCMCFLLTCIFLLLWFPCSSLTTASHFSFLPSSVVHDVSLSLSLLFLPFSLFYFYFVSHPNLLPVLTCTLPVLCIKVFKVKERMLFS